MSDQPTSPPPKPKAQTTSSTSGAGKAKVIVGEDVTEVEVETNGDPLLEGDVGRPQQGTDQTTTVIVSPQTDMSGDPVESGVGDFDPGPRSL